MEELTLRESIRKRPAMYIGSSQCRGFVYLLREISGVTRYDWPEMFVEPRRFKLKIEGEKSGVVIIRDFELGEIESEEFENPDFWVLRGFGYLSALSSNCELRLYDSSDRILLSQEFREGNFVGETGERSIAPAKMELAFELDASILPELVLDPHYIADTLRELAFLFPDKQFEIEFGVGGQLSRMIYEFPNGLREMVEIENRKGWIDGSFITSIAHEFDDFSFETAFLFTAGSFTEPFFKSFVYSDYTCEGGAHVRGLSLGIEKALKKFVRSNQPENAFLITHRTILRSLVGAVRVSMEKPRFAGSVKNRLLNDEIIKPITNLVFETLYEKLEASPTEAADIVRSFGRHNWLGEYSSTGSILTPSNKRFR